jgi:predicted transcriptional regulator
MSKTKAAQLDWRDGRRRRAWELKQQGWKQTAIAAALGVTPGAVSQWLKRARTQGVEALHRSADASAGRVTRLAIRRTIWKTVVAEFQEQDDGQRARCAL